jgi:hypothetical protein
VQSGAWARTMRDAQNANIRAFLRVPSTPPLAFTRRGSVVRIHQRAPITLGLFRSHG